MAARRSRAIDPSQRIAQVDSRKRLTVTEMEPGELYRVEVLTGGVIVLRPMVVLTKAEAVSRGMNV